MQIFAAQKKVEEEQISFSFGDGNELGLGQKDEEETRGLSITGLAISLGKEESVCIKAGKEFPENGCRRVSAGLFIRRSQAACGCRN